MKKHEANDETKKLVRAMTEMGAKQGEIAEALSICRTTLLRHYREELGRPGPGKPGHQKDENSIRTAKELAALHLPKTEIARVMGICGKTLDLYYEDEIEQGRAKGKERVVDTLFAMATNGKNTAATIFWLKIHMGWNERSEISGPGGNPVEISVPLKPDLRDLTDEQLAVLKQIKGKDKPSENA